MVSRVLGLGLLVTLVVLALSSWGGGQEQVNKAQPLPEEEKALRPGVYRSEEFKPSLSFKVGKGWVNAPPEASDKLTIRRAHEPGGVGFANVREVYKPTRTSTPNVDAPKDLVGWYHHHPYLKTSKPEPVTVEGVKGVQFDVVVEDTAEDYGGDLCGSNCVDIARLSDDSQLWLGEGYKLRLIVFEDMKGGAVTIGFVCPASDFDEFASKAQKVVDSVKWRGS